jgi:hypothetical protein
VAEGDVTYHELEPGDTLCSSWSGFVCVVLHVSTSKFGGAKRFTFLDLDDGTTFTEDCLDKQVRDYEVFRSRSRQ